MRGYGEDYSGILNYNGMVREWCVFDGNDVRDERNEKGCEEWAKMRRNGMLLGKKRLEGRSAGRTMKISLLARNKLTKMFCYIRCRQMNCRMDFS